MMKAGMALPLIVLSGALGIFVAPWFLPHRQPVCSASYVLGFNNAVAILAFAALLAALFAHQLWRRAAGSPLELALRSLLRSAEATAGRRSLWIAFGAATTVTITLLLAVYHMVPYIAYDEFGADVSRLELMVMGMGPHRDFQYNYGPAMLYPAHWLYALAGGRLSVEAAYFTTLLLHWAAGLSLLRYTVRNLCPGRGQTLVFLAVALAVFNLSLGVGYTPLRFLAPLASLLFLNATASRGVGSGAAPALLGETALAALLPFASLALSPEVGIATTAGVATYFVALAFRAQRRHAVAALASVLSLGVALLVFSPEYLGSILSHGHGANNFPVFPTPHILFLVVAAGLTLPRLAVIGVREPGQSGALAAALSVALGLMLAGAFGRCDPGHVLFNGLGALVLFLAAAVRMPSRRVVALMLGSFLIVFPALGGYTLFRDRAEFLTRPLALRTWVSKLPASLNEQRWDSITVKPARLRYGKMLPFRDELRQLLQFESVGTPYYIEEEIDRFLKLSERYAPEYYAGINIQVFTPAEVARKIRDLGTMNVILVSKSPFVSNEDDADFLSKTLFFPARLIPPPRNRRYLPEREILEEVRKHFTVVGSVQYWDIWRRVDTDSGDRRLGRPWYSGRGCGGKVISWSQGQRHRSCRRTGDRRRRRNTGRNSSSCSSPCSAD